MRNLVDNAVNNVRSDPNVVQKMKFIGEKELELTQICNEKSIEFFHILLD